MSSTETKDKNIFILREAGILNPLRLVSLIKNTIASLNLDLSGFTVLTEAASGPFVCTPVIAALARADRVIALAADSRYASAKEVIKQTRALEILCDTEKKVEIYQKRSIELFKHADIVTNLGFVRPIDKNAVSMMKRGAVITLMCETWEYRKGDVDLDACKNKKIPVLGTNEDFPGLEIFAYSGWLCLKLLLEAQIEIHKSRVVVVSSDKFGKVICGLLEKNGIQAVVTPKVDKAALQNSDVLVVADYTRDDQIIGEFGDIDAAELARLVPSLTVLQFAGHIDVERLKKYGLTVFPGVELESRRMARTLAELGPRPVVELHAAGLKVGEMAIRARNGDQRDNENYTGLMQTII